MDRSIGTVCFIVNGGKVLLAEIEYSDGRSLWNGIGGVVEEGETLAAAAAREISEETRLVVSQQDLRECAVINFNNLELHVFTADKWSGELEPKEPSIKRLKWFSFSEVPYSQMHDGNDKWLPGVLTGS